MVCAIALVGGCSSVDPRIIDPILQTVETSNDERVRIDFDSYVDEEWDELGLVCAFTTIDTVEKGLGFTWSGAPAFDSTDSEFLLFAENHKVIAWSEVPSQLSFCTYGEKSTDGIRVVLRENSQMTLVRTKVDDPLGSIDEYWLVDPASVMVDREVLEGAPVP